MKQLTIEVKESKYKFFLELLRSFNFVHVRNKKELILETDIDRAVEKGLKSRMVEEKNFEKEFKKHSAKWRKHYSE
jgi:hypothetical protein